MLYNKKEYALYADRNNINNSIKINDYYNLEFELVNTYNVMNTSTAEISYIYGDYCNTFTIEPSMFEGSLNNIKLTLNYNKDTHFITGKYYFNDTLVAEDETEIEYYEDFSQENINNITVNFS